MQAVYGWVKNIIYFMIFLAVVNNLLADSKYEKYIRFFAGMVLILLVVSPLTGKMRLDEQISSMFQSISLHNDASDLKSRLWNMDEKRLDQILGRYQDAVEADVAAMAAADGLTCVRAQVQIDGDRNSSTYGQVKEIRMEVKDDKEQESGKEDYMVSRPVNVEAGNVGSIEVRPVELGEDDGESGGKNEEKDSRKDALEDALKDGGDVGKKQDGNPGLEHLTGKVAQYYGLEESDIQIQWKND